MSRFLERSRPFALPGALAATLAAAALAWQTQGGAAVERVVRRADLVLGVDVEGELRALSAARLGPPSLNDTEFKIAFLAPESRLVRRGEPVLGFDTRQLEQALEAKRAELEEARQRLEQKSAALQVTLLDLGQELAQARAELGKARLKAEVPAELVARVELGTAQLEARGKAREVEQLEARSEATRQAGEAELELLRAQHRRAQARVDELRAAIAAMTVRAPQDGLVVHVSDWRDEKKKVGDAVWMMDVVVELPDLRAMSAVGDVDEADAAQVAPGQRVVLRLEARQDVDYTGRVRSLGRNVRRRSWRAPGKVFRVEIALDQSDAQVMRPAMRFRGQIEIGRVPGAVLVPREAVFVRADGPVAWVRGLTGFRETRLRLGRSNAAEFEVLAGLAPGQRVSSVDMLEDGGGS